MACAFSLGYSFCFATGLADRYVDDDAAGIRDVVAELATAPVPDTARSQRYADYLQRLTEYTAGDAVHQPDPATVRRLYGERQ